MRNSSGIERHIPDIGFGDRLFAGVLYPEFPIYLYIAGFRRQFSSPSRSKTSLWRPKISPSQTFPVDEL